MTSSIFKTLSIALISFILATIATTAEAQRNRLSTKGTIVEAPRSNVGGYSQTDPVRKILEQPHFMFRADYAMQNWILAGTHINECAVEWAFVDPVGKVSEDFIYLVNLDKLLPGTLTTGMGERYDSAIVDAINADPALSLDTNNILQIDRRALEYQPELYNLDLLVPLDQLGGTYDLVVPLDVTIDLDFRDLSVRCLTGAIGGPDSDSFNTPYAFATGETIIRRGDRGENNAVLNGETIGRYLTADEARQYFVTMVNAITKENHDPDRVFEARNALMTDVAFNVRPVKQYILRVLRDAEQQAEARLNAMEALQKKQADQAAREAEKAIEDYWAKLAKQRAFNPSALPTESTNSIMGRIQDKIETELVDRNITPGPVSSSVSFDLPEGRVSEKDVDEARQTLQSLKEGIVAIATAEDGGLPEIRNMSNWESPDNISANQFIDELLRECGPLGFRHRRTTQAQIYKTERNLISTRRSDGRLIERRMSINLIKDAFVDGRVYLDNDLLKITCNGLWYCGAFELNEYTSSTWVPERNFFLSCPDDGLISRMLR